MALTKLAQNALVARMYELMLFYGSAESGQRQIHSKEGEALRKEVCSNSIISFFWIDIKKIKFGTKTGIESNLTDRNYQLVEVPNYDSYKSLTHRLLLIIGLDYNKKWIH